MRVLFRGWLRHVTTLLVGAEAGSADRPNASPILAASERVHFIAVRRGSDKPSFDFAHATVPWGLLPPEVADEPSAPRQQHDSRHVQSVVDRNARLIIDRDARINQVS